MVTPSYMLALFDEFRRTGAALASLPATKSRSRGPIASMSLLIVVECRPEVGDNARQAEAPLLAGKLKDNIGISADIRVVAGGSLARSAGKVSRVKDCR